MLQKLKYWWSRPSYRELANECEQLRVQLAGCGVAALGYAKDQNDCGPGDYGHSASFENVKCLYRNYMVLRDAIEWIARDSAAFEEDCAHEQADAYVEKAREARREVWRSQSMSSELIGMLENGE